MLLHRDLSNAVFPWVEGEIEALEERCASNRFAINIALLLIWLRRVLYKFAAVIYRIISIFNTPSFRAFAASAASQIGKLRKKGLVLHLRAFQKTLPPQSGMPWQSSRWSKSGNVRQTSFTKARCSHRSSILLSWQREVWLSRFTGRVEGSS
jgi:hypothetical protein